MLSRTKINQICLIVINSKVERLPAERDICTKITAIPIATKNRSTSFVKPEIHICSN